MTRRVLALCALWLLACSPVERGDEPGSAPAPVASVERPAAPRHAPAAKRADKRPAEAASGAYQYVDETGHVQFAARLEDVPARQRSTAEHISVAPIGTAKRTPEPAAVVDEPRAASDATVVIYTTRSCPYCRAAIAYMDKIGQDYENRDVESDDDARDEQLRLTGGDGGVPVIVVGKAVMQGWNRQHFDQLLAQASR